MVKQKDQIIKISSALLQRLINTVCYADLMYKVELCFLLLLRTQSVILG